MTSLEIEATGVIAKGRSLVLSPGAVWVGVRAMRDCLLP